MLGNALPRTESDTERRDIWVAPELNAEPGKTCTGAESVPDLVFTRPGVGSRTVVVPNPLTRELSDNALP